MLNHPALLVAVATQRHKELVEEASAFRLAAALRRPRRQHWPDDSSPAGQATKGRHRDYRDLDQQKSRSEMSDRIARLDSCEVAGQVR